MLLKHESVHRNRKPELNRAEETEITEPNLPQAETEMSRFIPAPSAKSNIAEIWHYYATEIGYVDLLRHGQFLNFLSRSNALLRFLDSQELRLWFLAPLKLDFALFERAFADG